MKRINSQAIISIAKNEYIYSLMTRCISMAMSMLHSILVARYLGAEILGLRSYSNSVASIVSIVITFGIHQAYPYYKKKFGKDAIYDNYISFVAILYIIYGIIAVVCCFLVEPPEVKAIFILSPIIGYANIVTYISLIESPNKQNTIAFVAGLLDILVIFVLIFTIKANFGVGVGILAFSFISKAIISSIDIKIRICPNSGFFPLVRDLLKFGFFPMLALVMTTLNYRIDVIMLKQFPNITASMLGVYSMGINLADKIVIIPDTLQGVLVSKLSKGADEKEVAKISRLCFWATVFICIMVFIFGKMFISLFYGEEFVDAYMVVLITAFGTLFIGYFKLIAQYNIVKRRQTINTSMLTISIIVNIVFNLLLIPYFGINGAAFATGMGHFVCGFVFIIWFCKKTDTKLTDMVLIKKADFKVWKNILHKP